MSVIKGNGAPTKSTKGSVGDVYIDSNDNKNYRCSTIFRDSLGGAEYVWEPFCVNSPSLGGDGMIKKPEIQKPTPEPKEPKEPPKREPERRYENRNGYNGNRKQYNKQYKPNRN